MFSNNLFEKIKIEICDITKLNVDAIVNAANTSLLGGGGVDGAIHRAAGPKLLDECRTLDGCNTGEAKITKGYNLPAKYVIHTPGPIWRGGNYGEHQLLKSCYENSLSLAVKNNCQSVGFSAISTGVYGFPLQEATSIAVTTTLNFLNLNDSLSLIFFSCFDEKTFEVYQSEINSIARKE